MCHINQPMRRGRAMASVDASYRSIAIRGQIPITRVGTSKLNPITNSRGRMSSTLARAGIRGPKKMRRHMESRYIGVRTKPIAARMTVIERKVEVNASWLVIPRNTVISLMNPLMPGRARDAKELAKKKAKVMGRALARPPMFGMERVLVRS